MASSGGRDKRSVQMTTPAAGCQAIRRSNENAFALTWMRRCVVKVDPRLDTFTKECIIPSLQGDFDAAHHRPSNKAPS